MVEHDIEPLQKVWPWELKQMNWDWGFDLLPVVFHAKAHSFRNLKEHSILAIRQTIATSPRYLSFQAAQVHSILVENWCKNKTQSECFYIPGLVPSLKLGRGAIPSSRNPFAGINPSGLDFIQIVPPVMMMRTRVSGYLVAILNNPRPTSPAWKRPIRFHVIPQGYLFYYQNMTMESVVMWKR